MIQRPLRSHLFPYRRSSDLNFSRPLAPTGIAFCRSGTDLRLVVGYRKTSHATSQKQGSFAFSFPKPMAGLILRRWKRRSEEHTSELQSHSDLVCRLLLEKKN